jgi:hypothetical protein
MPKGGKAEQHAARSARLSAALRENLKRRKAQARSRAATAAPDARGSAEMGAEPHRQLPTFAAIGVASRSRRVGPRGWGGKG